MVEGVAGREPELAAIESTLVSDGPGAVIVGGVAGIGKSVLWERAVEDAAGRGCLVLCARCVESETQLSLSGLADLLDGVHQVVLPALPTPQRRALESALLLSGEGSTNELAVCAAFLSALRVLSAEQRVVVAVDDVQWLDSASAEVIDYTARRLRAEQVVLLMTHRTTDADPDPGDGVMNGRPPLGRLVHVEVGALSLGATRRLLATRSGLSPRLRLARQLHAASGGNPLLLLELAGALLESGWPATGVEELRVPRTLDGLLGARLGALSAEGQQAVLVTAMAAGPTAALVRAVLGSDVGLDDAVEARLVTPDGDELRLAHPLVGSVSRGRAAPADVAALHRRLADVVSEPEERARHLALGVAAPDAAVADELAAVSAQAAGRGAALAAAELAEQAWRFTPVGDPQRDRRLLDAAERYWEAAEDVRGIHLIEPELESLRAGGEHGRARLTMFRLKRLNINADPLDEVLVDADPQLRAEVLLAKADAVGFNAEGDVNDGRAWAKEAFELARTLGDHELHLRCVTSLSWSEAMLGLDPEPTLTAVAGDVHEPDSVALVDLPDRVRMIRAVWRGETAVARARIAALLTRADEQANDWATVVFTLHLFELAIRVGDWHEAERVHDELSVIAVPFPAGPSILRRCLATRATIAGDRATADAIAHEFGDSPTLGSNTWHALESRRASGMAALASGDWDHAAAQLAQVVDATADLGIREPGVFPAAPDLIEALVAGGRADEAADVLATFEQAAVEQVHPWGLAAVAKSRALLAAVSGDNDLAVSSYEAAIAGFSGWGLRFDAARSRLDLGILHRRAAAAWRPGTNSPSPGNSSRTWARRSSRRALSRRSTALAGVPPPKA